MPKWIKQIVRGCTTLPHVGEHPGTTMLLGLICMGALAGAKGGLPGIIGGAALMAIFMVPIYLYGAYDRANLSDKLQERTSHEQSAN